MFLKNNEDRLHNLAGRVVLAPGINDVDDDLWNGAGEDAEGNPIKGLKDQSGVQRLLKAKILEIVKRPSGSVNDTGTTTGPVTISDYDPADQQRLIGDTFDRATLQLWASQVSDADSKDAIDKQLAAIGLTDEERQAAMKKKRGG